MNIRHTVPSDDCFKARMRCHQSWYREHVLKLPAAEVTLRRKDKEPESLLLGSMLREEDGEAGHNFVTTAIASYAQQRQKEQLHKIARHRLLCNLLSSQPMAFNLFAPLTLDTKLATRLLPRLPGCPKMKVVSQVVIEDAERNPLEDGSSFDVFVDYLRPDGKHGFLGIEVKLTEPFSGKSYPLGEKYSKAETGSWWKPGHAADHFPKPRFNQLWRNHLMAYGLLNEAKHGFADGRSIVLYHPQDKPCVKGMSAYREHLTEEGNASLLEWRLDELVAAWEEHVPEVQKGWIDSFRARYLELELSARLWERRRKK